MRKRTLPVVCLVVLMTLPASAVLAAPAGSSTIGLDDVVEQVRGYVAAAFEGLTTVFASSEGEPSGFGNIPDPVCASASGDDEEDGSGGDPEFGGHVDPNG